MTGEQVTALRAMMTLRGRLARCGGSYEWRRRPERLARLWGGE